MTSFKMTAPPAAEPVLLADAKLQARIDGTDDDALIAALITAARSWAEAYTNRAFITQTWQMSLDAPPCGDVWRDGYYEGPVTGSTHARFISLPRPPLVRINSVKYFDNGDNAYVWDSANYFADTLRAPGRIVLRQGSTWPIPTRLADGIVIEYAAGYGDSGASVPEPIKTAIRQMVVHWYENRGEVQLAAMRTARIPLMIESLLDPYRVRATGV